MFQLTTFVNKEKKKEKLGTCTAAGLCQGAHPKRKAAQAAGKRAARGSACFQRQVSILLKTPCTTAAFAEVKAPPLPSMSDLSPNDIDQSHALLQLQPSSGRGGPVSKQDVKGLPLD